MNGILHIASTAILVVCAADPLAAQAPEQSGRPYEMEWAGRTQDTRPPLVDFEDVAGWSVECTEAEATFGGAAAPRLWGKQVGKLVYRGTGNQPKVTIRLAQPVRATGPFDSVNMWVYGNNWAWAPDPTTPQVEIRVLLRGDGHAVVPIVMDRVRWKEWWLMHRRLTDAQRKLLGSGAEVVALEVVGGRNEAPRTLYFDNLTLYQEPLPPLQFAARPKRGIDLPSGQTVGTNTGPGRLPFPTRPETILPDNVTADFKVTLESPTDAADPSYVFQYEGNDGRLEYRYQPKTGLLTDITAHWIGRGASFRPLVGGGVYFAGDDRSAAGSKVVPPERIELIECARRGDTVESRWRYTAGTRTAEVSYTLRLWQKSLVVDVQCRDNHIGEFRIGKAVGIDNPRLVTVPYLVGDSKRPAILVGGPVQRPLFVSALMDHCRSNASALWFENLIAKDGVTQNGGARYLPKTNGERNPCFERLFVTVAPRFGEVLPNIPNPQSPWMHVAGQRVWRAHGASDRGQDYQRWKKVARYGMTHVLITDHETGWRDGGESFTLRTRAAPGKGGDKGQRDYARKLHALGFRYGIYNNYTDFAPVNRHWDEDYVTRLPDGQWRPAWARCYNLKPSRAVELEARLAPIIQEKFRLDTAYCDVHTAVRPWSYCDFDARVPGAATFAATFYAYGEIMLHQKKTWNGPVYSEGNNHWYYCGLTDGNYGQDQVGHLDRNPWLVDFDLRKMHPLCCNFGMGNPGMFYGRQTRLGQSKTDRAARLDRFLAATLAFGHTGFLVFEGGFESAVQSYFCVQQVHAAYAEARADVIRYADPNGQLIDTSAAVASGAYLRSQVMTRYDNGLEVWVNGHTTDAWTPPVAGAPQLPPNGWWVRDTRARKVTALSVIVDDHRADYIDSPAYLYANGRGQLTRFENAVCNGQLIANRRGDGTVELIPVGNCTVFGVSLGARAATAIALSEQGDSIGPARTRYSRGIVFVEPVDGAFSYVLTPTDAPADVLTCARRSVVPGEVVTINGRQTHRYHVPTDATVGAQLWYRAEDAWIDFTLKPLVSASLRLVRDALQLELIPHLPTTTAVTIQLGDERKTVDLLPERRLLLEFSRPGVTHETVVTMPLTITAGDLRYERTWWIKAETAIRAVAALTHQIDTGRRLRNEPEKPLSDATRAAAYWTERSCGGKTKSCLFMHPPYVGGVGYTFAIFDPVLLPTDVPAAFRCQIGKADGSDPGDGILFRVVVVTAEGKETTVAEQRWIKHEWTDLTADLSRWQGRRVRIKLMADVGPNDNSTGDWACWSDLRIESLHPTLGLTVHDRKVQ